MATKKKKRSGPKSTASTPAKKTKKSAPIRSPVEDLQAAISSGDGAVEAIAFSNDAVIGHVKRVCSTRSLALDRLTGMGGLPFGRIVEISGKEQVGKTTFVQQVAAETQAMGGVVALYDTEEKWDIVYARLTGVDVDHCLSIQPTNVPVVIDLEDDDGRETRAKTKKKKDAKKKDASRGNKTIEEGIAAIDRALQTWIDRGHKAPLTIIWDSIAGTPTVEELTNLKDKQPGVASRELRRAMRVLTSKVARAGCLLLLVNQTYEKIGSFGFGPKSTTYGGGAIRYHATMRIELIRTGRLTHTDGTVLGIEGLAKLTKNSLGGENAVNYAIAHGRGFDNAWTLVDKLKEARYITVAPGGNYTFAVVGEPPFKWRGGFAELDARMRADPTLSAALVAIYKAIP